MERFFGMFMGTVVTGCVLGVISMMLLWTPLVGPWSAERRGMAELRQAQQNRQILVEQAEADRQVSILQATAEKEAATLRADAIQIVGQAAQDFPEYRNQEFIGAFAQALKSGAISQIIYVPTEANIPLLEAGRAANDF